MWYKFDPFKFASDMLPPILRSKVLLAILRAILTPLRRLLDRFSRFRGDVHRRINTTGQTYSLEAALNNKYQLSRGTIYITDTDDKQLYLYFTSEGRTPVHLRLPKEPQDPLFLGYKNEGKHSADFIVHVPSFLRGEEEEIRRLITYYKPAGRTYKIEFYDYE